MRARHTVLLLAALTWLAACGGGSSATAAPSAAVSTSKNLPITTTGPSSAVSSEAVTPAPAAATSPICTQTALQDAVNIERAAGSPLTVGGRDFQCQDTWAVVGATDTVNKAQVTLLFRWVDGRWQPVTDRTQACANQEIPAQLTGLACRSN